MRRPIVIALVLVVAACGGGSSQPPGDDSPDGPTIDAPVGSPPDAAEHLETVTVSVGGAVPVDILLVIDNSGSMAAYQGLLGANMHLLTEALGADGVLPDLHVGVVTSDLGSLGVITTDPACTGSDDGQLQTNFCNNIGPEQYLIDRLNPSTGQRVKNYAGTLQSAVSCMVEIGTNGCGFEQHLEAMRLALRRAGFVRPAADLAVLVLGDEDDCSAYNPEFFGGDPGLGPLDSFRCFEYGVVCNPDDPRTEGTKSGCVSREDSDYLHPMSRYIDFLHMLKPEPSQITVGLISGDIEPVEVQLRVPPGGFEPRPDLVPSCSFTSPTTGSDLTADPGIRMRQFLDGFPGRNTASTICSEDYSGLTELGTLAHRAAVGDPCFAGDPIDGGCEVELVFPGEAPTTLPQCDGGQTNAPCWHVISDASCPTTAHAALAIETETPVRPGTRAIATCRVH